MISPAAKIDSEEIQSGVSQPESFSPPPVVDQPAKVGRIVIAKRDRFYGQALEAICQTVFGGARIEICSSGLGALESLRAAPADLLVTGMSFGDTDGLEVLRKAAAEKLALRTLVVSHRRDEYSLYTLRTGRFDGFFDSGEEDIAELQRALKRVVAGTGYISPSLRPYLIENKLNGVLAQRLTRAEIQVLGLIGDGSGNAEAAVRLKISEFTVQKHRRNIMQKLDVSTSGKLVCQAVRLGVVRITERGHVIRTGGS